jgi:hypothetical protein
MGGWLEDPGNVVHPERDQQPGIGSREGPTASFERRGRRGYDGVRTDGITVNPLSTFRGELHRFSLNMQLSSRNLAC